MKKIIFLVLAAVLLMCASAGCIAVEDDNKIKPDRYYDERYIKSGVYIYVDEQTGVEYLVGRHNYVTSICPRYNADGTLKINEEFKR